MIERQDYIDFSKVPQSKGMGKGTIVITVTGVIMIFIMGGLSVVLSGYGHMWPSSHTERMPLGKMPSQGPQ